MKIIGIIMTIAMAVAAIFMFFWVGTVWVGILAVGAVASGILGFFYKRKR